MYKRTVAYSLLALLIGSFNPIATAQADGTITLLDENKNVCSFDIPGPQSGVTKQFNLTTKGSSYQCEDWKVRSFYVTDLPSAATIYMTDNPWCAREEGEYEITLRTMNRNTSMDAAAPWEIAALDSIAKGSVVVKGVLLQDKRVNQGASLKDTVKCIEVATSPGIDTPPLAATALHNFSEHALEEYDSEFNCPAGKAIVMRNHKGDERDDTTYGCAELRQNGKTATFGNVTTSEAIKESGGHYFTCPPNQVMTGRDHDGDENGDTRYRCASPIVNGHALTVKPDPYWSFAEKEHESTFDCRPGKLMAGRWHDEDDERGYSRVRCATVH
ncbi:hypothetical protein ACI2KE_20945 [Pseudomonas monteilii]|jgi:hypothetical protein